MSGALAGLKVIEIGSMIAAPFCAQILGDHGATVIKVESPAGDISRAIPPLRVPGEGSYYSALNRNKQALALDLTQPAAREVLLRLLADADVLIENLLPGTMARWGLDYATELKARFPRLIYCDISGFGTDGPLGGRPGYDAVVQAACGLMSLNGTPESGMLRMGIALVDLTTGMNAATGVLLAVAERARSGLGQKVEVTLHDSALAMLVPFAAKYFISGETEPLVGNGHASLAPYDKYAAADGDIFIGVANVAQFKRLLDVLDCPALAQDARFADNRLRAVNRHALNAALEPLLRQRGAHELTAALMAAGVPAAPVVTVPQALESAHAAHRAMTVTINDADGQPHRSLGAPIKLDRTPATVRGAPHAYGSAADALLPTLGYDAAAIAALEASGALLRERRG